MPIRFNTLLEAAGISPAETRLLRHQDTRRGAERSVYRLWREDPARFNDYQRHQAADQSANFAAAYWASFVVAPDKTDLLVGLYRVSGKQLVGTALPNLLTREIRAAGTVDAYTLEPVAEFADLIGRLVIDWGPGTRSWVQRADNQNKIIVELRPEFREPEFPGYAAFTAQLSEIDGLPWSWVSALSASRGVYVLTCPRTREQYVGAAYGAQGFMGRWREYAANGHGGNVVLKSRDPSDYRVAILETAGSQASESDVLTMEQTWKDKLQSGEMGLNGN